MGLSKKHKEYLKLYSYKTHWSDEDKIFVASVEELPGCVSHAKTMVQAILNAKDAAEGYLETMIKHKKEVPAPLSQKPKASGRFIVRMPKELHQKLLEIAREKAREKSFNKFVIEKLEELVEETESA